MPKANGSSRIATKEEFLAALKRGLAKEEVELPELGLTVLVWELTAPERIQYQETLTSSKHRVPIGKKGRREIEIESHAAKGLLKLCALALKDENGRKLYEESDLVDMPARVLQRIFTVAERLSGLGEEAEADAGKDFSQTESDAGSSSSRSLSGDEASESS